MDDLDDCHSIYKTTGGPAIWHAPYQARAAPFPQSEWSAGQPVCKLSSERTRPGLPFCQPYGSTETPPLQLIKEVSITVLARLCSLLIPQTLVHSTCSYRSVKKL